MLTRSFRLFLWFALGFVLSGFFVYAHAETVPAITGTVTTGESWWRLDIAGEVNGPSCDALAARWTDNGDIVTTCGPCTGSYPARVCAATHKQVRNGYTYTYGNYYEGCPAGYTNINGTCSKEGVTCPAGGYTLSADQTTCTRPECPNGRNEDGTCKQVDPCAQTAGQIYSQGLYDGGVDPNAAMASFGPKCAPNGCFVVFGGTVPAKVGLVNGVTHYYALGKYEYFPGATQATHGCTPGAQNAVPTSTMTVPPDTCAANQGKATMNGKTVCINTTTGQPANTNGVPPDTTPQTGNTQTTNKQVNAQTGATTTTVTTTAPDGSTSVVTTTCDSSGANCSSSTTNTPGAGGGTGAWSGSGAGTGSGSGSGSGSGQGDANGDGVADDPTGTTDDSTDGFCAENPSNPMCAEIKAGAGAGTSDLYTKGSRTPTDVFNDFGNKVKTAGFYSAATNYFSASVPAGSCSGLSQSFDFGGGHSVTIDLDSIFCGSTAAAIFSILGYGLMLAASWTAFRIAIL